MSYSVEYTIPWLGHTGVSESIAMFQAKAVICLEAKELDTAGFMVDPRILKAITLDLEQGDASLLTRPLKPSPELLAKWIATRFSDLIAKVHADDSLDDLPKVSWVEVTMDRTKATFSTQF